MRDIKFRAWNSKDKVMYEGSLPNLAMTLDCKISQLESNEAVDGLEWEGTDYSKHLIPLQYTGLEDKNGVDIYEGDIVEIEGSRFRISFEIGSFMIVRCLEETCMYEHFASCWNDNTYPLSQLYWEENCDEGILDMTEVKGNIYENPELLEGRN